MNVMDKVIMKEGDTHIDDVYMLALNDVNDHYIFCTEANLVYENTSDCVFWNDSVGAKAIRPLKTSANYVQIDETTYELDIAPYKNGPLSMQDLF